MEYLLFCRSLTYAQRGARVLERAGITGTVSRVPKTVSTRGCSYCIIVPARHLGRALSILASAELSPERIFVRGEDGTVKEAPL